MTHEDAGHYAAKHPSGTLPDERIADLIRKKMNGDEISCSAVHAIAGQLAVAPAEVGVAVDLLEARICKCQMGLFGYSPKKMIVQPAAQVAPALEEAITAALVQGRLSCRSAWEIAARLGEGKMVVAAACEKLKIKIFLCQIGSFS
ncbi:MAG: hypothetical protein GY868_13860 [Deltaproteobacteria bacterium]|nr:hypothetical protein [Deltaproteobacteria bacterium]